MSAPLTVLVLGTRAYIAPKHVRQLRERLRLGPEIRLQVVLVHPPVTTLAVDRVDVVDLSRVPYRPLIPVSGPGLDDWGGARKLTARVLRLGRRATEKALRRPPTVAPARALEIAASTSSALLGLAEQADAVVAWDAKSAPAVARLGERTSRPALVYGPANLRPVLEAHGRELPPVPAVASDEPADTGVAGGARLAIPPVPAPADAARRLLIAPANYAGQAHAWAEAVRAHVPDATAMNAQVGAHPRFPFPSHYVIEPEIFRGSLAWRRAWRRHVMDNFTHVIAEVNRPLLGAITDDGHHHVVELQRAGKKVALLSHGSDARIPSVHAANEQWHSYAALDPRQVEALERASRRNSALYNSFEGTVFVSTPGLITFVPKAVWLPLVIDVDAWDREEPPLTGAGLPVVAHIPSSSQKGSHMIDPVLRSMHERGLIEYRRVEDIPHEQMPEHYGSADIVVEQFGIADYSAAAVEAMSAGRVVVSRVADAVRERVQAATGHELPIVEANPTTLEQVILDLVADPDRAREVAARGRTFAREIHDGRRSASILQTWLDGGLDGGLDGDSRYDTPAPPAGR